MSVIYVLRSYSTVPRIYGSKQTESEGVARGRGLFTIAIVKSLATAPVLQLLYIPPDWSFVVITVNTSVHVQVFTVTSTCM